MNLRIGAWGSRADLLNAGLGSQDFVCGAQCARRTVQSSRILFRSAEVACGVEVVGFVVRVVAVQGSRINFTLRGLRFTICVSRFKV